MPAHHNTEHDQSGKIARLEARIAELEQAQQANTIAHKILDLVTESVIIISKDGTILETNRGASVMFGIDQAALIGQSIDILLTDENDRQNLVSIGDIRRPQSIEIKCKMYDGTTFWCDVSINSIELPDHPDALLIVFQNINDLVLAMQEMSANEQLYLSLVDTLPVFVYRIDLDNRLQFINQALKELIDLPYSTIVGQPLQAVFPFDTNQTLEQLMQQVKADVTAQTDIIATTHPQTNQTIHLKITIIPVKNHQQQLSALQGIIEDVSQRIHAENELRASRKYLRHLIQQIPIGIQVFDLDGLCVDVNQAHLDIFDRDYHDLVGEFNIFGDRMAAEMPTREAAIAALDGKTTRLGDLYFDFSNAHEDFANPHQDDRVVNVTIFPIFDHRQQVIGFVGVNVDVTERKQREQELQLSEARYRAVVEDQTQMISRYKPDGTLTFVNLAFAELIGQPASALVGTRWQDLVTESETQEIQALLNQITPEQPTISYEEERQSEDGQTSWVEWNNHGIFNDQGKLIEYQGVGTDITEKKLAAERRFQYALEQERINILRDFVVRAGHEFRTPLSIINSSAYAMTRITDTDQLQERMQKINNQVDKINKLVDSLTQMSRLDTKSSNNIDVSADANRVLNIIETRFANQAAKTGQQIHITPSDKPLLVNISEKDLMRVLIMIMQNAIRHTKADDQIYLSTQQQDNTVIITVEDTGEGMDQETLKHIFERFYRADKTGKTSGLGLGLPIAKSIIEHHHGIITIDSEPEAGTTVTITFPIHRR